MDIDWVSKQLIHTTPSYGIFAQFKLDKPSLWTGWNYNAGLEPDEYINDKFNSDIIALMSSLAPIEQINTTMIWYPTNHNKGFYTIQQGCYSIYSFHERNVASNN